MNAKAIKVTTLALLLTMSGSAWAVGIIDDSIIDVQPEAENKAGSDEGTGSINNTIKKGIDNINIGVDDLGNIGAIPGKIFGQFVGGSLTFLAKNLLGDVRTNVFGKKDNDQNSSTTLAAGNAFISKSIYAPLTLAITKSLEDPFNSDNSNNVIKAGKEVSTKAQQIITEGISKRSFRENAARGIQGADNSGVPYDGLDVAAQKSVESNNKSGMQAYNTALKTSQAYKLADLATDKNAVAANTANTKRMQSAMTKLTTETNNAVSTRATIQSLNHAVAALMKQDLFGNERLQDRLNLMLLQGARTNDQLGDIVTSLRAEDAAKTEEYNRRVDQAQREANNSINNMSNNIKNTTETLIAGTYSSDDAASALSFGDIDTKLNGKGPVGPGGEVLPGSSTVPTTGTTEEEPVDIPVSNPENPNIPKAPMPTAGKPNENPTTIPVPEPDNTPLWLDKPGEGSKTEPTKTYTGPYRDPLCDVYENVGSDCNLPRKPSDKPYTGPFRPKICDTYSRTEEVSRPQCDLPRDPSIKPAPTKPYTGPYRPEWCYSVNPSEEVSRPACDLPTDPARKTSAPSKKTTTPTKPTGDQGF